MEIKRVGVASLAKILGVLYAGIGLIIGGIFSLAALIGSLAGQSGGAGGLAAGLGIGLGSFIFFPVVYGLAGVIGGCITAVLYNMTVRFTGGLMLEVESPEMVAKQFD